jgi:digeranylgeranylglycerophospholipid reductase
MKKFDVVIIGAGIAGINVARYLGNLKLKVCLIDSQEDILKQPFYTLGSFIDLEKYNLSNNCIASKVTKCLFHSDHISISKKGTAYILDKEIVHKEIIAQFGKNVVIQSGTTIQDFQQSEDGDIKAVIDTSKKKYYGSIFVDASGIAGVLTKKVGLQDSKIQFAKGVEYNVEYLDNQENAHLFIGPKISGGYAWIFPLANKRAIFGFGSFHNNKLKNIEEILDSLFNQKPFYELVKRDSNKMQGGILPITSVKNKLVHKNVLAIGDSVSQVNPLVGEGYRFLIDTGHIAAPVIKKAINTNNMNTLKDYEDKWNKEYFRDYYRCKQLQQFAGKISSSSVLSNIATLILGTKRNKTFSRLIAGKIHLKDIFLP